MADEKPKKARKPRPRPVRAINFTVYSQNGDAIPDDAVAQIEAAFQRATFELFNQGIRLLNSTSKA